MFRQSELSIQKFLKNCINIYESEGIQATNIDRLKNKQLHEFSKIAKTKSGIGRHLNPKKIIKLFVNLRKLRSKTLLKVTLC